MKQTIQSTAYTMNYLLFHHLLSQLNHIQTAERSPCTPPSLYILPISFMLSHAICPLDISTLLMAHELASWVLASHPSNLDANATIHETVKAAVKGKEYRATLGLTVDGEIEEGPFSELVRLLLRATEALFVETGELGMGTLVERGALEGVGFVAGWTWFEIREGVGKACGS